MLYPAYIHKDPGSAYGATIPDLPGLFSAADDLADLPAMIQDAAELMFDDEKDAPAPATAIERWQGNPDYQGGFWMMVDIDLSKINTRAIRLNISLPENLVGKIDSAASARRMSRSAFLAMAAEHELRSSQ